MEPEKFVLEIHAKIAFEILVRLGFDDVQVHTEFSCEIFLFSYVVYVSHQLLRESPAQLFPPVF